MTPSPTGKPVGQKSRQLTRASEPSRITARFAFSFLGGPMEEAPVGMVRLTRACVLLRVAYYKAWRRVTAGELPAEMIEGRWYIKEGALQQALAERDRLHRDKRRLPRP